MCFILVAPINVIFMRPLYEADIQCDCIRAEIYTDMFLTLKPLDMVYVFSYITLNSKVIKENITVTDTTRDGLN